MHASRAYPSIASLLIAILFMTLFILPIGYTYDETCPRCHGEGVVTCETCHGSGKCWICEGTGKIWYMPESDNWCAACQGTGRCYACEGRGSHVCEECGGKRLLVHWMYTAIGSTVVLSIITVFLFLGLFFLSGFFSYFYLSFNEWLYEVRDMGFWFNPSFMTWLFARHRERWARWQTGLNLILAIFYGILLFGLASLNKITKENFFASALFSIGIGSLFSFLLYKSYVARLKTSK